MTGSGRGSFGKIRFLLFDVCVLELLLMVLGCFFCLRVFEKIG